MSMQFSEALDEMKRQSILQTKHHDALTLILSKLFPEKNSTLQTDAGPDTNIESSTTAGGQSSTSSHQVNSLSTLYEAGGSDGAAGHSS
jgi:hypothetical protein